MEASSIVARTPPSQGGKSGSRPDVSTNRARKPPGYEPGVS